MLRFSSVCLLGLIFAAAAHGQEKAIAMTPVTYDGLKQEVLKYRGKVLVVDFWRSDCVPCIFKGFPHIKKMHEKYAALGLEVITVSTDPADNPDAVESANKTLNKRLNVPFRHLHLTDPKWTDRLGFSSIPCYYVFDRHGRWVRIGGPVPPDYDELEKTVVKMLSEK